ncbi:uncharacterized protein LOC126742980 [Anthonomus grandis grandis]|uniref:uncharacterized protein LOC126742980 n=1 Tax=Anthonomus grandis grandis TaxID=2921223 RepID=UPI0021650BD0|nr:uncharacterized protein LOC126742980 [Anthonomus grandis grandis]
MIGAKFLICVCFLFVKVLARVGDKCDPASIRDEPCPTPEELCDQQIQTCQCAIDYNLIEGVCVFNQTSRYSSLVDNEGDGSLIAGIFIPLGLVSLVICSIYLSKRFELVKWLRERLHQRNQNYDEFMIGQDEDDDDPVLA